MEHKFSAGVILYNPTEKHITNLNRYFQSFDVLYIFDNSADNASYRDRIKSQDNIKYHFNGGNAGVCVANNWIINVCVADGVDYLCTLDQDSTFEPAEIEKMKEYINDDSRKDVGVYSPFVVFWTEISPDPNVPEENVDWVITSGSFMNILALKKESIRFDEKLFIERTDQDICVQLRQKGYRIIRYNGSILWQCLGEDTGHKHPSHIPLRHYYSFRNRFYYDAKYYKFPVRFMRDVLLTAREMLLILLYEDRKAEKLKMYRPARKEYLAGRMGKRQ